MTRTHLAVVLGVVAVLAVGATVAVAWAVHDEAGGPAAPRALVVRDPASGATFEVPAAGWTRRDPDSRVSYGAARVVAPVVLDDGYCAARPAGSFRALAGFTDQTFATWFAGLADDDGAWSTGTSRETVELADGSRGTYRWTALLGADGPCAAAGIELAMVTAGDVRAVVVADSGEEGAPSHDDVREILLGLELP